MGFPKKTPKVMWKDFTNEKIETRRSPEGGF